jgi:flagellar FliL protein
MADEMDEMDETDEAGEVEVEVEGGAGKSGGGLIRKIAIPLGAVVLLSVGVVTGPIVMNIVSGDSDEPAADAEAAAVAVARADRPVGPALYQSLLPPLVINIKDSGGSPHFMQMSMEAMSRDQEVVNAIREHTPVIRNNLILLYGNATYESVTTREGKETLLQEGLSEIQSILEPHIEGGEVEALYFTALVVQ